MMERMMHQTKKTKVGIVVERNFGERLAALARSFHIWVIKSPVNTPFIKEYWSGEPQSPAHDPLASGITSFTPDDNESPEDACARIAGDVEDHHGEFAQDPPWSEIEVFGVKLSDRLREVFAEIGVTTFEPTPDGFICRRTLAAHG